MQWRTCIVLLCVTAVLADDEWLEVKTAQGPVRGRKHPNGELYVFYNIPYATAPAGEDRFKAPLPPPTWMEPFEAVDKHVVCPQGGDTFNLKSDSVVHQEDCLIVNLYVPDTNKKNLSVIVSVHGGGFVIGHGEMFKATYFLKTTKDIIWVTFNYRLGIHGFLCLGTDDVPGNAGMKDQVVLLRWVQKNIASFGGNPNDVTIEGFSAGSAAVDLLMLSKSAEGLFHKVIPESGGNLAAFTVQRDPVENAKIQAKKFNFTDVDDIYALEKFYKTAPMKLLTSDKYSERKDSTFLFGPCVERDTGDGAFLLDSPLRIFKKGTYKKLPVLYGIDDMEGLFRIELFALWKNLMNEKFSDFLPVDLRFESQEEKEEIADKIKRFYFGDKPVGDDTILKYIDYFSDIVFTYPVLWAVKLHAEAGNKQIYLYEYSFVDEDIPVVPHTNVRGAKHCAQTLALMDGNDLKQPNDNFTTPGFRRMKKIVHEIWHNFVKTGKPVPEGSSLPAWPAAGADRSPHMSLGEKLELRGKLLEERTRFWDDIYQKYYRDAEPPPKPRYLFKFNSAPLPPPVWLEPYEAIDKQVACPQPKFPFEIFPKNFVVQDDCLIANVYVPDTKEKKLSVIVYVHGGAFIMGYGELLSATHFMETKDFILVTFNYRLGIHGFLCLGTEDAPGNAGMKDQVALLRWVQKNIASFGGNPNDVTIAGYSAGSASVDLLMLSQSAEGLFHRVIPESGGNLAAFAIQRDPVEIAKTHAKTLNFTDVDDIYALEKFYKTASMELLTSDPFLNRPDSTFMFSPCVERDTGDGAFLTESPFSILKKGNYKKLPVLYGFANMEGLLRIDFFPLWKTMMNEKFSDFLPADLTFKSEKERDQIADKIKRFYFGDDPVGEGNILKYVDFFSDVIFTYPMLWAVKLHAEAGNNQIYLYEYSFVDDDVPVVPHTNIRGANHCAQTGALMDGRNMTHADESLATPELKRMKKIVREIWHNFMKTGKPVLEGSPLPAWPAAGADRSPHMSLGQKLELRGVLLEERTRFWEDIYQRYYRDAVPPPTPPPKARIEL